MNSTITIGRSYRIFLKSNFKYEGMVVSIDDVFLKINDIKLGYAILIPLVDIKMVEED